MFRAIGHECLFVSKDNGVMNMYRYNFDHKRKLLIKNDVDPVYFHTYIPCMYLTGKITETNQHNKLLVVLYKDGEFYWKKMIIYHNFVKTEVRVRRNFRIKVTCDMIGEDYVTMLNDIPVKKLCTCSDPLKDSILTSTGQLHMIQEFNSDIRYDLSDSHICLPDQNDEIVDIDCSYNTTAILTRSGNLYKITQRINYHYYIDNNYPIGKLVKIASNVKQVKCSETRIIFQTFNNDMYIDSYHEQFEENNDTDYSKFNYKLEIPDTIKIIKFDCSVDYLIVQTESDQLLSCRIGCYSEKPKNEFVEICNVSNFQSRFNKTKSAKSTK